MTIIFSISFVQHYQWWCGAAEPQMAGLAGVAFASGYEELMLLRLAVGLGVASTFTSAGRQGQGGGGGMFVIWVTKDMIQKYILIRYKYLLLDFFLKF